MRLTPGSRLGPYEVVSILGSGGMAEVYRARDTRLGRSVALKVVNEALSQDPELLQRFEQEARLAGSLNHPNLVAVYDVGSHDGAPYFVTELLKGESLRERLSRGRPSLETALDWGTQLAQGLAAAHASGIVHRDVKPDNVFVTSDGQVKLLDFGIAKLGERARTEGPHDLLEETVTPKGGATRTGAILGTPAYMSPEQVRGEKVDARSDIFSLGAVLHEMLSGQRPFRGGSLMETGHSILHDEPPPLENVPSLVAQLVRRCLAKEPEGRIQSARDLAFALEMLHSDREPRRNLRAQLPRSLLARSWWALVLLAALAAAAVVGRNSGPRPTPPPRMDQVTLRTTNFERPARFTPDGRIVFSAKIGATWELFERNLASPSIQQLGVHGSQLAAISPTNELAIFQPFLPQRWGSATLARVSGGGGTPRVVADGVRSADWGPSGELAIIKALPSGSTLEYPIGKPLSQTKEPAWLEDVRVSPQGNLLAFIHHPIGDFAGELVIVDLTGARRRTSRHWFRIHCVAWTPGNEVWFTARDSDTSSPTIQALPVEGPEHAVYATEVPLALHDVSPDGRVLVGEGFSESDITFVGGGTPGTRSLAWRALDFAPRLSADGRVVLFSSWEGGKLSALLRETSGSPPKDLGRGAGLDLTPDGRTALLGAPERDLLWLAATGAASRRSVRVPELNFEAVRLLAGGTSRAVATAQTSSDLEWRLYSIDLETGATSPVSPRAVDPDVLEASPDGTMAAAWTTVEGQKYPTIFSLPGGEPIMLRSLGPDVAPAGWASNDELWLTRVEGPDPSSFELIRFDVKRTASHERRSIGSGVGLWHRSVHVTPDGKNVVFMQERVAGHLYVLRGLVGAH